MSLPGFLAERSLYVSQIPYVGRSYHMAVNANVVTIAQGCPGQITGNGYDERTNFAPSRAIALVRARIDAQRRCPAGCIFNPIPIAVRPFQDSDYSSIITRIGRIRVTRERLNVQATYSCISPPKPPTSPVFTPTPVSEPLITGETVDTVAKVVGVAALAGLGAALIISAPATATAAAAIGLVGLVGLGIGD